MKISRIKKITNVGNFSSFRNGGSVPLGDREITVIYGENTVGKTTLTDIFRSANEDSSSYIVDRVTIPNGKTEEQEVGLCVISANRQKNVSYKNGSWQNNLLKNRLYIFDQKFIQDNIFEGIKQTRDNKTNFTNLILGSKGVEISKEIEKKKEELSKYPQKLSQASPDPVRHLSDEEVVKFCQLKVDKSIKELEQEKNNLTKDINKLQKINTFRSLQMPNKINGDEMVVATLEEKLKKIAESRYDRTASTTIAKISKELERLHKTHWVEEGMAFSNDENCPFCNQSLKPVSDRIDAYKKLFDAQFEKYKNGVLLEESEATNILDSISNLAVSYKMNEKVRLLHNYDEFVAWPDDVIYDFDALIQETKKIELDYSKEIMVARKAVEAFMKEKNKNIGAALKEPNINLLKKYEIDLSGSVKIFNEALNGYCSSISKTAEKLKNIDRRSVETQLTAKKSSIAEIDKQISRINQDTQCKKYLNIIEERKKLKKEIRAKQDELEKEQATFLEKKFEAINDWFERLGSRDFNLNYKPSRKGNKPTCDLMVKYKNQEIESGNFKTVFSESDRRNLALSIFLACADDKTRILVLDDPVVSFDDNRILMTVNLIKELSAQFCQIIITTHYKPFVIWMIKQSAQFGYLELIKDQDGSKISQSDCSEIVLSDYERQYTKINAYANGDGTTSYSLVDLRKFLENHINIWYQPYIPDRKMQLKKKLDGLLGDNIISQEQFEKYNQYREQFNPDGHEFGAVTDNELRNIARNLLKDLYEK